jgi:hypothetical protein
MNETVKSERLKPTIACANLRDKIIDSYPENSAEALLTLPKRRVALQNFSRKRRLTAPKNFDPLEPPEEIFVSLLLFGTFTLIFRHQS